MKFLNNISIVFPLLSTLLYSFVIFRFGLIGVGYFYTSIFLSLSLLSYSSINNTKNIVIRSIAMISFIHFLLFSILHFWVSPGLIVGISSLIFLSYGVIGRRLKTKNIISDKYNEIDNFIIIRKPIKNIEFLRAYFCLDDIGSIKSVSKGMQTGFKIKCGISSHVNKHTYNQDYYLYIKTNNPIVMKNNRYNILTNNCINTWNVNIKKLIKDARYKRK